VGEGILYDDSCSMDGSKKGGAILTGGKLAENRAKNNFCALGSSIDISDNVLGKLQERTEQENVPESELTDERTRADKLNSLRSRPCI
jgi:hypothetical protein